MKKYLLLPVIMLTILCCTQSQPAQEGQVINVNATEFKKLVDAGKGTILDVRTPEETSEGRIAGAVIIDFQTPDFSNQISKLDKSKEVYVYCEGGGRSSDAAQMLRKKGYKVYNLEDGFADWKRMKFPVEQ